MKRNAIIAVALLAAAAAGTGVYLARRQSGGAHAQAAVYRCPMHPEVVKDRPGDCPICNMALVREEAAPAAAQTPALWTCPMHPEVVKDAPGTCPICNMDLVRQEAPAASEAPAMNGWTAIMLSEERRRVIGLKSEAVARRTLTRAVRASGRVAYDPDLYNATVEYREASRARLRLEGSALPEAKERAEALLRASELKLRQMGLSAEQIKLAATEEAATNLLVGGAAVWVYAQVYEQEAGLVKPGQAATLTTPAFPGRTFKGTVRSLDPILDPATRSLKARIFVPNPDGALKLEMYADVSVSVALGAGLALPESALIDTGERRVAFVDLGDGRIEPRVVEIGTKAEGYYELKSGVAEGEKVVTSANFLVDSESRLKAAVGAAAKKAGAPGAPAAPADPHAGHR